MGEIIPHFHKYKRNTKKNKKIIKNFYKKKIKNKIKIILSYIFMNIKNKNF